MIDKVLLGGVRKEVLVLTMLSQIKECFQNGWHNTGKTGVLLLRKQEGDQLKWDVNERKPGKK